MKYDAVYHQTNMVDWPEDQQKYTLVLRKPKSAIRPTGTDDDVFTWISAKYQVLKPAADVAVQPDSHTDSVLSHYQGEPPCFEENKTSPLPGSL